MPCRFYSFWVTWRGLQCLFRKLKNWCWYWRI
jgi:hypothetical protein